MGLLGSALSAFGLGQEDIKVVTNGTLKRVDKRDILTEDQRKGVAIALSEMLNELRAGDVITSETHNHLFAKIEAWQGKAPGKKK
jgi:hypothetical protein